MESPLLTITNVLGLSKQAWLRFVHEYFPEIYALLVLIKKLKKLKKLFSKNTKNVVILGSKASGKTTLWNQLRGKIVNSYEATSIKEIKSFYITTKRGIKRKISTSYDIGGDDVFVPDYYDKLIKEDNTFIFFLVDLTKAEEEKEEICARLQKIVKIIEDKQLKEWVITIVGTFFDKYTYAGNADTYLKKILDLNSISESLKDVQFIYVNLLEDKYIEKIKEVIIK